VTPLNFVCKCRRPQQDRPVIGVSKRGAACKHSRVPEISANVCVKRKNADEIVVFANRATLLARARGNKHSTRVMVNRRSMRCAAAAPVAAKKLCTARPRQHVFGGQTAQNGRISAQLIRQRAIERCRRTPAGTSFSFWLVPQLRLALSTADARALEFTPRAVSSEAR